jgi:hypothetical protein
MEHAKNAVAKTRNITTVVQSAQMAYNDNQEETNEETAVEEQHPTKSHIDWVRLERAIKTSYNEP